MKESAKYMYYLLKDSETLYYVQTAFLCVHVILKEHPFVF
jgi:hypothetical protein